MKKIILYISPNGFLGGAEKVVLTLAQSHLNGANFDPIILFYSNGEAVVQAERAGIKYFVLNYSIRLSHPIKLFNALKEIRKIIKELKPELIHNTMAYSHLTISLAIAGLKIKTIWFQHGPVGKTLDKLASLFPVNLLFFNSQYLKDLHNQYFPHVKVKNQTAIIPLGVRCPDDTKEIFVQKKIIFGSAGRICEGKSYHYILEVLGQIKKEGMGIKCSYTLLIAGSPKTALDKIYFEYLIELQKKLDLDDEITFLGHVEDMNSFYQQIDVFIHSTLTPEPFGLVVAEAMAHGCFVIASNQGGVKDLIVDGKTGFSYSSTTSRVKSIFELKKKINTILSTADKSELKVIANSGKIFIKKNYSIQKMNETVEKLYLSVLN